MAKVTESPRNTQQQTQQPQGQQQQVPPRAMNTLDPMMAFGMSGDQSRAGQWAHHANEAAKAAGSQGMYRIGTIPMNGSPYASCGYVAFEYKNAPVFCLVFFESRHDSIIRGNENGKEYYTTVADLVTTEFLTQASQVIRDDQQFVAQPYFLQYHVVPLNVGLTDTKCTQITTHLLAGILSRGDIDGQFDFSNAAGIAYSFSTNDEGAILDRNDSVQRADWVMAVSARAAKTSQYTRPTLTDSGSSNELEPVEIAGYTGLRYVGPETDPNTVTNAAAWDPAQLQPELTVTSIDAITAGRRFMLERSIVALSGVAEVARVGGWVPPLLCSLKEKGRKLSNLAENLYWATKMDFSTFDSSQENKVEALKLMCNKTASVNMIHRNGDSLGGLSALLAEIALGDANSLSILVTKLDEMFRRDNVADFSARYAQKLGTADLSSTNFVATAIPVVSGTYQGTNGPRSFDDVDLVYIANRFSDNADAVGTYVVASSYDHRNMDPEQIRMYLMEQASQLLGGSSVKFTGNALNMVIEPAFLDMLINEIRSRAEIQMQGVESYTMQQSSLFLGGRSYAVGGAAGPNATSAFGNANVTSNFKF